MDPEDDVNRRYFVHYVERVAPPGAKVLDFGCGAGSLVRMLRDAGFDAYGVNIRWPAADRPLLRALLARPWLRRPAEALFRRLAFEAIEVRMR